MVEATPNVMNEKVDLNGWNATLITLIPKVREPLNPKEFSTHWYVQYML